ncbi:uncharacterized protein LOC119178075 isoform X3 [Rhipicephalus microplus]
MGAPTTSSTFWLPSHESHQVTVSNKWADQPSSVSTGRTNWLPFDRTYQDSESSTWTAHLSSVTSSTPRLEKEQHNQGTLGGHGTWPAGNMSKSALLFMLRFFGIARHVAGDGGQPKIQQLLFIYRMLSVNNLVRPPKRASVDGDGPQLLFKLQDLFSKEAAPVNHVDSLAILLDDVLLEPTESEEEALADLSPKECILDYLAGYVAQKFSEMCCTDCVESLKGLQRSPSDLILVKSRGYL